MLEIAEIGQKLAKTDYRAQVPALREGLVRLQYTMREADFAALVLLDGDDRIGTKQALNRLKEWFDPRFLRIASYRIETPEETGRPLFWRYWRELPGRGEIGIFHNAWTIRLIAEQIADKKVDEVLLERRIRHVNRLEETLTDDGILLLKFWLHRPKSELRQQLEDADEDPEAAWQTTDADRTLYRHYDRALPLAERVIRLTSSGGMQWIPIESTDARYRDVTLARALHDALEERLAQGERRPPAPVRARGAEGVPADENTRTILDTIDLGASLAQEKYEEQLLRWQGKLARAAREAFDRGISSVLVFQGWDASGKGGTIRRLMAAYDASICRVVPVGAPSDEERAHHYLWRFWRQLPAPGCTVVFDRSWYERVLVERVEGFADEMEWRRAYREIRDFEEQLCEHGIVVLKFWLHIDPDEQLRRFEERERTPFKRYKISEEDYRNRKHWVEYEAAVNEMVARTNSRSAPWHLIAANDKRHARVAVLKTVARRLQKQLEEVSR